MPSSDSDGPDDLRRWRLPRGRHGLPREIVERSQRERLLAAVVRVTVSKGYEATTVADILGEAGVGRESFYEIFDDKLDCMLAAHEVLIEDLEEQVRVAYATAGPWPGRMREALATTLRWFAADPEVARFTFVELSTVGPAFRSIFQADYARFTELLDEGLNEEDPSPALTQATKLAVGAILARIYEEVVLGRAEDLPHLLPDLTYNLLVPFVGEEAARAEQEAARSASE
ncbi:MAG TPA: TetR/AcrR family transcriptional regulator [Solirubrobacterales bacterium]|nr:TetR/AcrR family transcriptional regulator [Solirubrobacterales bacterium]